jgi:hypothetical protein
MAPHTTRRRSQRAANAKREGWAAGMWGRGAFMRGDEKRNLQMSCRNPYRSNKNRSNYPERRSSRVSFLAQTPSDGGKPFVGLQLELD